MMFPLNPSTILHLVLIGVVLSSALALRFGWRWRFPLLLLAIALPAALLFSDSPTGQYAVFRYIFVVTPSVVMLLFGAVLGSVVRYTRIAPLTSVVVLFFAAGAFVSFALWRQYVPSACLEKPLQVRIAGKTLHLPPEMRPRLENGFSIVYFGRTDKKSDYARLCRMSRNGARAVEMDTVWITPAANHEFMTATCKGNEPPAWCGSYTPVPYRHIEKILIASEATPYFPLPFWREGGSLKKERQGNLVQGSVCLLPEDTGPVTHCWVWRPFGKGFRLTISSNNLDKAFIQMPAEEARELIRKARDMTLAIVGL